MAANTRFSVALHVLGLLAWRGEPMKSSLIARSVGTNPVVIRRLLRQLSDAGLVVSQRGPLGGTELARKPTEISLLDVFHATGNPSLIAQHPFNRRCPFYRTARPGFELVIERVETGVRAELAKDTLADALRPMKRSSK